MRMRKYYQAVNEAQAQAMEADPNVYVIGLGVPSPTGIFGTTTGLLQKFGADRVLDMPSSEGGMTGVTLGTTIAGYRPVMVHMRVDFAILAMDQMVNQVAKWHFMYGGKMRTPMVFRMIIGRGWGQGPQHSQSLQSWFAHVPGFKVIMPTTPHDAKGMLMAAIRDDAPVIVFEHRWLYGLEGEVPEEPYFVSLDKARVAREGADLTIVATSYMVIEALRAADILSNIYGIGAEIIDLRSLTPIDVPTLVVSVKKTGALVAVDTGGIHFGTSAEIVAAVTEAMKQPMKAAPKRIGLPSVPSPTSPSLAEAFFPRAIDIAAAAAAQLGLPLDRLPKQSATTSGWHDTPDPAFTGPY